MEALKQLTNNVPGWLTRLDDLGTEVVKRQAELAALDTTDKVSEARSLRNKGSTESLKPKDDGPANLPDPMETCSVTRIDEAPEEMAETTQQRPATANQPQLDPASVPSQSPLRPDAAATAARQAHEAVIAAHSRVRQIPQKRQRPSSVLSGEGQLPAYRTRTQIIVYYDAHVQKFFDDLVRFVSASRNLLRKAKMAIKVAHIKKLAEMESQGGDGGSDEDEITLPSLRYMSTRRYGAMAGAYSRGPGSRDQAPDIYDQLDKGLEFVQSTCEHGAHQFLRDADCNDEIKRIQKHLRDVLAMAEKEKERVLREEPELAKESLDTTKVRTRRPISMRRESSTKDGLEPEKLEAMEPAKLVPEKPAALEPDTTLSTKLQVGAPLEVDSDDGDEGIDIHQLPRLNFRSTRYIRR